MKIFNLWKNMIGMRNFKQRSTNSMGKRKVNNSRKKDYRLHENCIPSPSLCLCLSDTRTPTHTHTHTHTHTLINQCIPTYKLYIPTFCSLIWSYSNKIDQISNSVEKVQIKKSERSQGRVTYWLVTCSRKTKVSDSNPVANYVLRWVLSNNRPANI